MHAYFKSFLKPREDVDKSTKMSEKIPTLVMKSERVLLSRSTLVNGYMSLRYRRSLKEFMRW